MGIDFRGRNQKGPRAHSLTVAPQLTSVGDRFSSRLVTVAPQLTTVGAFARRKPGHKNVRNFKWLRFLSLSANPAPEFSDAI